VLELANRLVPRLGGAEKVLRPTRDDGPEPVVRPFATPEAEGREIVAAIRTLGVPLEDVAILCRTNARLTDFEELLHDAHLPFQGASLLQRDAARRIVRRLERLAGVDAEEAVRAAATESGWLPQLPDKLGDRELVRQTDLSRLVALAEVFDGDAVAFVADLRRRFDPGGDSAKGVHLLTLHRAKGLEFEAVFLPRLEEKELPSRQARSAGEIAEERRLLYVGMTRAKRVLWLTWSGTPSRFLADLGITATAGGGASKPAKGKFVPTPGSDGLYHELAVWRRARAEEDEVPPYVVFDNKTLDAIARTRPQTLRDLSQLPGVGPVKLERYGDAVLALVRD
jgi:DNA helicase-2/ATP-dependent DNA helicase PcrA